MAFPLHFHWSPEEYPKDISTFVRWCQRAEAAGMESIRIDSAGMASAAAASTRLAFCVPPEIATADRRWIVCWNGDGADVDTAGAAIERCRVEHPGSTIEVEGDTAEAAWLAIKHAHRLVRRADRLDQAYADALPVLHMGVEVGLSACVVARRTRDEAVAAAGEWFGTRGVLAGSFDGIADALAAYGRKGIGHILLRGRPGHDDLGAFAEGVLPRVRELEVGRSAVA